MSGTQYLCSVAAFARFMTDADKYVVWDGVDERPYVEDPIWHDCAITQDLEYISIQKFRREILANNIVIPTLIFACKPEQPALEAEFNGKIRGIFTYFWNKLFREDSAVTFREAICRVNTAMERAGFEQRAEIVCREDILDMRMDDVSIHDKGHLVWYLDICRTKGEPDGKKIW